MISQETGEGLPMSSIVYVGRGSFRMEAVAIEAELERRQGVVQPMEGVVTAPLHATARASRDEGRRTSMSWRAPSLQPLFGSQVDLPLLAAPTGSVSLPGTFVTISRAALAALGGVVLLCGVVIGTAVRHLLASPAAVMTVSLPASTTTASARVETAAPIETSRVPAVVAASPAAIPLVQSPAQTPAAVALRARTKPAVKRAPIETVRKAPVKAVASHWVDPFAE